MYVDGSLTPVNTFNTPVLGVLANNAKLFVGRQQPAHGGTNRFAGCLDELEFFKRVLSDAEIHSIWAADSAGKCKPGANLPYRQLAGASVADGQLALEWSKATTELQSADKPDGPWTNVEDATSG